MKEAFEKILKEHGIYGEDVYEILYAVNDMICFAADKLKKDEPYATVTINRLESVAYEVFQLATEIE